MSPEQTTWFEAVRRCRGMGGHLAGKDLIREDNVTLSGSSFWTSLTRIRQKWIDGNYKLSNMVVLQFFCMYIFPWMNYCYFPNVVIALKIGTWDNPYTLIPNHEVDHLS